MFALASQELIYPEDLKTDQHLLQEMLDGKIQQYETQKRYWHKNGYVIWVQLDVSLILDETGQPHFIVWQIQDISAQIRKSRDLQIVLNNTPAMIGYWDTDLQHRFGNFTYGEWFGFSPEQMKGLFIWEVIGENLYQRNREQIEGVLRGEEQFFEREITDIRGERRQVQFSYVPDMEDGYIQGFVALGIDITARHDAEKALFKQKELARITLESIGDSVIAVDTEGRITLFNPVAQRMTGWSLEKALGKPIEEVMDLVEEGTFTPLPNPIRMALSERKTVGMSLIDLCLSW
ncbi:PAS domain S-box protein [Deinococcus proteolyticus]|uniref:PAS domain S-box protein n=1 Tax=Deinococcus proteolyticus TaxID=55148 RepID=UPI00059E8409|nr:PAS domain S-box protein [Deinococcus proteolyticus]